MTFKEDVDIPVYNVDMEAQPQTQSGTTATATAVPVSQGIPVSQAVPVAQPQAPKTVDVIAPTNMAAGYQFNVDSGGNMMRVAVPAGGVVAGQRFAAIILQDIGTAGGTQTNPHSIPNGRWRDELCDCCKFGCCHPMCCLACWFTSCALGQVMTRMKLSVCGDPLDGRKQCMPTFRILFIITAVYQIINWILTIVVDEAEDDDERYYDVENDTSNKESDPAIEAVGAVNAAISLSFGLFILIITIRSRGYIRRKFNIPGNCFEDCCCSFWCSCCTVCQMARHTADYDQYSANCCSDNGLNGGAPDAV
mmetsp:Transcript_6272/g.12547  ORF Transcript_6272/g.12547 Transcript_6272/m.12547 type:complete len:307 (+) Transcript_6272:91-1011(+)